MEKKIIPIIIAVLSLMLIPLTVFADSETVHYNVVGNTNDSISCSGAPATARIFSGMEITSTSSLVGLSASRIQVGLEWDGGVDQVTGIPIRVGVWDSTITPTPSNFKHLFGTIDTEDITTNMLLYNFTSSGSYEFEADDALGVFFDSNNNLDCIRTLQRSSDAFNSTSTRRTNFDEPATWTDNTGHDFGAIVVLFLTTAQQQCQSNPETLFCRLEAQGGALGGNFANNPFDISQSSSNILIQTGFLDGSDTDPATNGTGYLILAITLIIANVLLWIGTGGKVFNMGSIYLPALISLVIIMGFTVAGLVDATVLIISIVALVALASPKIVSMISGARGGGSTE